MTKRQSSLVYVLRYKRKVVLCACGCGGTLPKYRVKKHLRLIYGTYPRYIRGHGRRRKVSS